MTPVASLSNPEAILSGLTYPVYVLDENNCFSYANTAGEEFLRVSLNLLKGESLSIFFADNHSIFSMIDRV